ncbi:universal stress protein [Billgrantia gudaonensis]|uniref:Nucleotide-binding universal stress protein, UspA family n=1 Tax=Billgrantia gudaonensis TaxID=376427 RepID=A0A1G9C5L2_9GAMM|nr:universal stress protein [Halomonas gudaonensis]SDK46645.1 Nucleotide-binding universal stress protein, UspA family [Halomonas gudaonensis]
MTHAILVPLDGSAHAEKALAVAAQLARSASATLHLLHVSEYPDDIGILAGAPGVPFTEERRAQLAERMRRDAEGVLAHARGSVSLDGVVVEEHVREGRPNEVILAEAEALGVDTIVMGSRGMSNLQGMLLGSVSHKVSHAAPCTVITVT